MNKESSEKSSQFWWRHLRSVRGQQKEAPEKSIVQEKNSRLIGVIDAEITKVCEEWITLLDLLTIDVATMHADIELLQIKASFLEKIREKLLINEAIENSEVEVLLSYGIIIN